MTTLRFLHEALPARVLFGAGTLEKLPAEVERLGLERLLVLSTPQQEEQAKMVCELLGGACAGMFAEATMHTPVAVTDAALTSVAALRVDGLIAIGGGSTIGLSKAIALRTDLPQVVIPTTYAGSEVTPILGETKSGLKTTQSSLKVLPETVIYDVALTMGLPVPLSVSSGLNALAHAAEALYAREASPIVQLVAEEGVRALVGALPRIVSEPSDPNGRADALYGAWLCGTCLGSVGMALHHKLCHAIGGAYNLPHAETHSVVLPHALAYNLPAAPAARERLTRATGWPDPAADLQSYAARVGAPISLRELGMPREGIDKVAALAFKNPYWNPRPLDEAAIRDLLERAWTGAPAA
jgi:maleylacetate reductase